MKITHIKKSDFKEIELEIDDEFFKIADEIHELTKSQLPILISEDGKKLKIRYDNGRKIGENDTHAYLITIEKIPFT